MHGCRNVANVCPWLSEAEEGRPVFGSGASDSLETWPLLCGPRSLVLALGGPSASVLRLSLCADKGCATKWLRPGPCFGLQAGREKGNAWHRRAKSRPTLASLCETEPEGRESPIRESGDRRVWGRLSRKGENRQTASRGRPYWGQPSLRRRPTKACPERSRRVGTTYQEASGYGAREAGGGVAVSLTSRSRLRPSRSRSSR